MAKRKARSKRTVKKAPRRAAKARRAAPRKAAGTIKVVVETVPTSGGSSRREVEVAASGAPLKDVLLKAGMVSEGFNFTVNGVPAKADTHVGANASVEAREVRVVATERASGS